MGIKPSIRAGLALAAALLFATGCEKPTVAQGSKATVGGVEFEVGEYEIRYLEVADSSNTYEYPQPALVLPVTVKNVGEGDFTYTPTHSTQQMSEAQTPLLYVAPTGENADDLPPQNKTMINGVFLSKGQLPEQVTKNQTLAKGETVKDLLLFEVPDEATKLILSIPPALHRGNLPVLFKVDFTPAEAMGPKVHAVGDPVAFGTSELAVTATSIEFVKTRDRQQGEGFSSEPLLKVSYKITNNGKEPVSYDPAHRAVGGRGASLYGKSSTFKRVKFGSSVIVDGQQDGTTMIEPGSSITDFVLFDRPPEGTTELTFEYPATLFGGSGLGRFAIEYEYKDPPKPKELEKPEPKKPEPEQGG